MEDQRENVLRSLSEAFGPPGFERDVRQIISDELGSFCEISHDRVGSIICHKKGTTGPLKVMLAAHMDEIGFMVRFVKDDGCASFVPLGGWRASELPGMVVILGAKSGYVKGVIGSVPVHFTRSKPAQEQAGADINQMFVDFGAKDKEDAKRFGVGPGTPFIPCTSFSRLEPGEMYLGKAWDDRAGCAAMVEAVKRLADDPLPHSIYAVGTVQEEVGAKGAMASANLIKPDVAIVVEGSPANDTVGGEGNWTMKVGDGPQIRFYDPTLVPNRGLVELMIETAETHNIPYQVVVRDSGGTDGKSVQISGHGVPCAVISVVCRYIHSAAGLMDRRDFDNTVELLYWLLKEYDETKHARIASF